MTDSNEIERLFTNELELSKYKQKRWVRVPDSNKSNYNQPILYNCRDHKDKLVSYHDGYILVKIKISSSTNTVLLNTADVALKNGNNCVIEDCRVRIEGTEIDQSRMNYITMTYLNLIEYSDDYAKSIAESYGFAKDNSATATDNAGHTKRKLFRGAFNTGKFSQSLKIPLSYMSTFFRRLDFPIINHTVELEWNPRLVNSLLKAAATEASVITIEASELILPVVELPSHYESKFYSQISHKSSKLSLNWGKIKVYEIANLVSGQVDYEVDSSVTGIRKLFAVAIPQANWNNQTNIETVTNATLSNFNVVLDGEQYYAQNITDDALAYELLKELFNNGGEDYNTGSCLSYLDWLNTYKIYCMDLSRQRVLEADPRKAQSVRFRCELPTGNYKVLFILEVEKQTTFYFSNPSGLSNV